ncbi:MAG: glycosyltransferase family 39 protein [bacterium]
MIGRGRVVLAGVLLLAVILRGGFALLSRDHDSNISGWEPPASEVEFLLTGLHSSDTQEYLALARGIGQGAFGWGGAHSAWRVPGYPLFLFLLGRQVWLILLVQVLLGVATVALVWATVRRLAGPLHAPVAALIVAVDAGSVLMAGVLLAETLFTFLLASSLWLFLGGRRAWAAVVLGSAVLVRPVAVAAVVPLFAFLLVRVGRRQALAFGLIFLLLPVGWAARNLTRFGRPTLSTDTAFNLYYTHAGILLREQTGCDEASVRNELVADLASDRDIRNPVLLADRLAGRALARILGDPVRYAWIHARGTARILASVQSDDIIQRVRGARARPELPGWAGLRSDPAKLLAAAFELLLLTVVYCAGLAAVLRRGAVPVTGLALAVGLLLVLAASPLTAGRLRVPAMPFLAVAAAGLVRRDPAG